MNLKSKLIILTLLIESLAFGTKYDAELMVSGKDIVERIEGTISNGKDGGFNKDGVFHSALVNGLISEEGQTPLREALWLENKGTVHNLGSIVSEDHTYQSQFVSILVFRGISNKLIKTDRLIYMNGGSYLINDGLIQMGAINQQMQVPLNVLDLIVVRKFADYTKNVIVSDNATIKNNLGGRIVAKGDDFRFEDYVSVNLLPKNNVDLKKNVINMKNSVLENAGEIKYDRDLSILLNNYVSVDLLKLGMYYNRDVAGVLSENSTINNSGTIFIGGDFLRLKDYQGIEVNALGLDIQANHSKYGIKSTGGVVTNTGTISVERNYVYGKDENGEILKLELIKNGILELGLLSFENYNEKSIGVSMNGGKLYNNGGTISVGVNNRDRLLQIFDNAGIAVQGSNNANIVFNENGTEKSTIILDGADVWLGSLTGSSTMTLNGTTDIIFRTQNKYGNEVGSPEIIANTEIFGNDGTGNYVINGVLNTIGEDEIFKKDEVTGEELVEIVPFDRDITIGEESNVDIGVNFEKKKDELGNDVIDKKSLGQLNVNGKLTLEGDVDVASDMLIGEELGKYNGNVIITAKNGIEGEGKIKSGSFVFDLGTDSDGSKIWVTDITRKNFNDIVKNSELGSIFEDTYNIANEEQLVVYRMLAQGKDERGFDKVVDEVTGKDTLTTLPAQIYDITRDLNRQFKDFAVNNNSDGVVFKYINSDSKLDSTSSTVGFERESSGIMVGYNNNISEKLRLGLGFAYIDSDIDYTSSSKNNIKTWNIRGYSDYDLGFAKIFNDISFGYNQSDNKRMAEQIGYTGIKEGDLDIYTLSLNNSMYKEYKISDRLSLRPSLNLDFTYISQEDFEEEGMVGASAEEVDTYYITTGIALDGKYNLLTLNNSKINLNGGIDYSYDIFTADEDMSLKVSAFDPYYKEELRELDKKSFSFNIGVNYEYRDRYSFGVSYIKELINDVDNDQFAMDFSYKF